MHYIFFDMDFKLDSFIEQILQNKNNRGNVFQIVLEKSFGQSDQLQTQKQSYWQEIWISGMNEWRLRVINHIHIGINLGQKWP